MACGDGVTGSRDPRSAHSGITGEEIFGPLAVEAWVLKIPNRVWNDMEGGGVLFMVV